MIPKIIHYCWLSNDPQPDTIRTCIVGWHKYLPDYEIRLWNMQSLDYNAIAFTREAAIMGATQGHPFIKKCVGLPGQP